ncbi:MAG TPA: sigma-70 family RNA polymerase sigma factor [Bacteroidetes bacterium]|nr:sigma-70 family RNA polymerase sigma factor [Bacteroidota bacterium]
MNGRVVPKGTGTPALPDLWQAMLNGDEQALATLFRLHYAMLFNYGMKIIPRRDLVKDSIQDLFVYLWEKRRTISPVHSVQAYLLACLRRRLVTAAEAERKTRHAARELNSGAEMVVFSAEDLIIERREHAARSARLQQALHKIPSRMYEALYLKKFQGLSYDEISEIMKVTPQVAKNYVFEAVKRLRQMLNIPDLST